jgi:hypothetical protein
MIDALGAITGPAAEPFLARLLADLQPEVRGPVRWWRSGNTPATVP